MALFLGEPLNNRRRAVGGWLDALRRHRKISFTMSGPPCPLREPQMPEGALEDAVWVVAALLRVSDGTVDGDGPLFLVGLYISYWNSSS